MGSGDSHLGGYILLSIILGFYGIPILWVLSSSRSSGGAKFGWFMLILLFGWLGLAVFLIATQAPRKGG
jgi:hypothetical protein